MNNLRTRFVDKTPVNLYLVWIRTISPRLYQKTKLKMLLNQIFIQILIPCFCLCKGNKIISCQAGQSRSAGVRNLDVMTIQKILNIGNCWSKRIRKIGIVDIWMIELKLVTNRIEFVNACNIKENVKYILYDTQRNDCPYSFSSVG